jgi:HD domain
VRGFVYALPIVLSLALVLGATTVSNPPTASLWAYLGWWLVVSVAATAVVWGVFGLTRRLLPLGALFQLSLVFPDEAPSRFSLALSARTVTSLEERVRIMREAREASSMQEAAEILLRLVAALDRHDRITAGHAERVRGYSAALGRELGLTDDELDRLNWAALLHDVGKLGVSPEILNKAGRPTEEEWKSLRRHPLLGEELVEPLREWLGEWIGAVPGHHERWDGTGYPRGLAGEEIPRAGRIVAIADAYDVITSMRSYKAPASAEAARAELVRGAGTQFDPGFVRTFFGLSLALLALARAAPCSNSLDPVGRSNTRGRRGRCDDGRGRREPRRRNPCSGSGGQARDSCAACRRNADRGAAHTEAASAEAPPRGQASRGGRCRAEAGPAGSRRSPSARL